MTVGWTEFGTSSRGRAGSETATRRRERAPRPAPAREPRHRGGQLAAGLLHAAGATHQPGGHGALFRRRAEDRRGQRRGRRALALPALFLAAQHRYAAVDGHRRRAQRLHPGGRLPHEHLLAVPSLDKLSTLDALLPGLFADNF
jgi:hypothetical protein